MRENVKITHIKKRNSKGIKCTGRRFKIEEKEKTKNFVRVRRGNRDDIDSIMFIE